MSHLNLTVSPTTCKNYKPQVITPEFLAQVPKIEEVKEYLKCKAKQPPTIETYIKALKELASRCNLNEVLQVEKTIADYKKKNPLTHKLTDEPVTNRWKRQCVTAYLHYCKVHGLQWIDPPVYKIDQKSIQPPTDEKCSMILAYAKNPLSLKIDISTQTGLRPVEVVGKYKGLKTKDIHLDTRTITPTSAKGCNARPPIPINIELTTKLQVYIIKHNLKPNDVLFPEDSQSYSNSFLNMKKRLAEKMKDPTITSIRLYDLRHYYVTKLVRKIQNAEIARIKVGHKRLDTTQKYMHLLADLNGEWITEQTNDRKRADELVKADYTYVLTTPDGYMQFKKMK